MNIKSLSFAVFCLIGSSAIAAPSYQYRLIGGGGAAGDAFEVTPGGTVTATLVLRENLAATTTDPLFDRDNVALTRWGATIVASGDSAISSWSFQSVFEGTAGVSPANLNLEGDGSRSGGATPSAGSFIDSGFNSAVEVALGTITFTGGTLGTVTSLAASDSDTGVLNHLVTDSSGTDAFDSSIPVGHFVGSVTVVASTAAVPEPSSMAMLGLAGGVLCLAHWRRRKSKCQVGAELTDVSAT